MVVAGLATYAIFRIAALPIRLVAGAIFIYQGWLNIQNTHGSAVSEETARTLLLNLKDYGFGDWATDGFGVLLIVAGVCFVLGIATRIVAMGVIAIIVTNLFAGFATIAEMFENTDLFIRVVQNRLLLTIIALILMFTGGGMFSLGGILMNVIFKKLGFGKKEEKRSDDKD